jgi:hypothetical protein
VHAWRWIADHRCSQPAEPFGELIREHLALLEPIKLCHVGKREIAVAANSILRVGLLQSSDTLGNTRRPL